ncbi:MAG TPA: amino acid carrier protein, partial [Bacillota bacterium]|nr:amino acid carrier protein [Bacillota bacterium]
MSDSLLALLTSIRDFLWGVPCTAALFGCGIYFLCKSGFYPARKAPEIARSLFSALTKKQLTGSGISPLMALSTALGGTVGIGSIIGIAYAINTGGAGSIFWMWISGFIGMSLKYAECSIAVIHRRRSSSGFIGGTQYVFSALGKQKSAVLFCVACILTSLGTGSITQVNAVGKLLKPYGISDHIVGTVLVLITAYIISGGRKKIGRANEFIMPTASILYVIFVLIIIFRCRASFFSAISSIFENAFGINQITGGICGASIINAFRTGFSKGVFSNEAGMGTSPIAHSASEYTTPHLQGQWGIFEVFFDTFIVSTLTAVALISSGQNRMSDMFMLFYGNTGNIIFTVMTVIFAYAAMLSWCFYAESCIIYLSSSRFLLLLYRIIFCVSVYVGVILEAG